MLNNIDVLNNFQNLKLIDAANCYIEEVNLSLPKLEELNLSNNFLKAYPVLANMSKLKTLNLNSNKLADLKSMSVEFTPAL
jgi:Leucine-rich repeat (LRR) protein